MFSTIKLNFDLARKDAPQVAYAVQGESNTRILEITLRENGVAWVPPPDASVAVAFKKPDGTRGVYDMLPNKEQAITVIGNTVTAILAPQVLTCPGEVAAALLFVDQNGNKLMSFPFCIMVAEDPSAGADVSNDYFYFTSFDAINDAIGDMSRLETDDKTSLVAAINAASRTGGNVSNEQIFAAVEVYLKDNPVAESVVSVYVVHNNMAEFDCEKSYGDVQETILEGVPVVGVFTNTATDETEQILAELHDGDGEIYFRTTHGEYIFYADESWEYDATASGDNGQDGFSPIANVTQTDSGAVISITDKSGTTTATITNGEDGLTPYIGENGNWWIGEEDTGVSASGGGGSSSGGGGKETVYEFTTTEVCTEIADTLSAEVSQKIWDASMISIYVYMAKDTTDTTTTTEGKLTIKLGGNTMCEQASLIPAPATSWINYVEVELIVLNMLGAMNGVPAILEYRKQNQSPSQPALKQAWMFKPNANGYGVNIIGSQNFGIGTKVKIAIA